LSDEAPPKIRGEAIQVQRSGMPSGLIYWNGSGYRWYLLAE
jgi:hypothetical protein